MAQVSLVKLPPGNKSLPEPMLIQIYGVTRPQWVNYVGYQTFTKISHSKLGVV